MIIKIIEKIIIEKNILLILITLKYIVKNNILNNFSLIFPLHKMIILDKIITYIIFNVF